jgi:hypothetical protein
LIEVGLGDAERDLLRALPEFLDGTALDDGGPAWATERHRVHRRDPGAERRYQELTGGMLDDARRTDRRLVGESLERELLTITEADAWVRVIGDARLRLAARLGIEEAGWEEAEDREPVEQSMLRLLGFLQDVLVSELTANL